MSLKTVLKLSLKVGLPPFSSFFARSCSSLSSSSWIFSTLPLVTPTTMHFPHTLISSSILSGPRFILSSTFMCLLSLTVTRRLSFFIAQNSRKTSARTPSRAIII